MSEEDNPLAKSSLQQGQYVREHGVDIITTVVHQLTEKVQFLAAGLKLDQFTQPVCVQWTVKRSSNQGSSEWVRMKRNLSINTCS